MADIGVGLFSEPEGDELMLRAAGRLNRLRMIALALPLLALSGALAQEIASTIRDDAGMFDAETVRRARSRLERIERQYHVPVSIETIDSLNGEPINDVAVRRDRAAGNRGIFILMAQENKRISNVLCPAHLGNRLTAERRLAIRDAFVNEFRKSDFDTGLDRGIDAIEKVLSDTKDVDADVERAADRTGDRPPTRLGTSSSSSTSSALIERNRIRLTLAGARRVIRDAEAKADELHLKVNVAVVDDGGHLLTFERMDGARPASGYTALTKATTAATFRAPSGPVPAGTTTPDALLNISLQNAAAASGGKLTTLPGGVPIVVDGQVIGGVGVGGGTGEQDADVARAGIAGLLDDIDQRPDGDR